MNQDPESRPPVRVLVVDDSAFMRTSLSRMIASEAGFEVVGTACNGEEALARIPALNPDVVTLDVQMPVIDGLETLRCIMREFPRPVIMVSAVTDDAADTTFRALGYGAFDYVPKKMYSDSLEIVHIKDDLILKIRAAAQSVKRHCPVPAKKPPQAAPPDFDGGVAAPPPTPPAIVAVGASTGGPRALQEILPLLPHDLPVPLLIVQHMPAGFTGPFAHRLDTLCSVAVREAVHNQLIEPGVVYIAPAGVHLTVRHGADGRAVTVLDRQPENHLHIPSVDVMMKAVAENFGSLAMGVILTGMGSDGAEGMYAIRRQGGLTVGQDEASCTVYGMPKACAEQGSLTRIVPLSQIPEQIMEATRCRKRA